MNTSLDSQFQGHLDDLVQFIFFQEKGDVVYYIVKHTVLLLPNPPHCPLSSALHCGMINQIV